MYMKNNYKKPDKDNWLKNILIAILLVIGIQILFMRAYNVNYIDIRQVFTNRENKNLLLQEFIVNIRDENKSDSYLKLQISLECKSGGNKREAEENIDKIRDIVIMDLVGRHREDFKDYENISRFSEELRKKVNNTLGGDIVAEIYVVEILTK